MSRETDPTSRRILVTGASGGIGRAIAARLAADGFHTVLHYGRNREKAESLAREIETDGGSASVIGFDVRDRDETAERLTNEIDAAGPFYGAVVNAGVTADTAFPAMTGDDWDRVLDTNLGGLYNVLRPLVMPMVRARRGGRIVTLSSVSGVMGNRGQVNYSASKGGVIAATKALALELASRGITANSVAPGLIETEMVDELPVDEMVKMIPAKRLGRPEEVAGLVSYLCSDEAGYVTRQVFSINGGMA